MKRTKLIFREILNFFYLKKVLRRESASKDPESPWNKYNLRYNWYGRIYTVLSLREEDMGEEEVVRNWKAMEMMRPINTYLSSLDFQEVIFPSIEYVPGTRSYLVVYSPLFKELTFRWVLWRILAISAIVVGAYSIYTKLF
jgi:hypothetical protein